MKNLILSVVLLMLSTTQLTTNNPNSIVTEEKVYIDKQELTKENVINFINQLPIQHPDILYQKIILETGHLKSSRAVNDNNLIGMRVVHTRINTQSGKSTKGYGKYADWRDSIIDYLLWQQYFVKHKMSREEYYQFTAKIYSSKRDEYVKVLRQIKIPKQLEQRNHTRRMG